MSVLQALASAWKRTVYLLWEKGSRRRWLSLGALAGAAAGGMITPPTTPTELSQMGLSTTSIWMACGLFTVLTLGLGFICAVARFVMLEDLVFDRDAVLEPGFRFGGLGGRLFVVQVTVFVVNLLFLAFGNGSLSWLAPMLRGGGANVDIYLVLGGLGFGILSWFALRCVSVLIDEMIAPIMYRAQCGPLEAARRFVAFSYQKPGAVLSWAVVRFFAGIACGLIFLGFAGACLLATSLLVGIVILPAMMFSGAQAGDPLSVGLMVLTAVATFALFLPQLLILSAPGVMLLRLFSIYSLQNMDAEIEMLPVDGRKTIEEEPQGTGISS